MADTYIVADIREEELPGEAYLHREKAPGSSMAEGRREK